MINLPDGKNVMSTHVCDNGIPGLPTVLMGNIVLSLAIASLIGIFPLCMAGCKAVFDNNKWDMMFDGAVILTGYKDLSTDLWTLPILTKMCTALEPTVLPQPSPCLVCAPNLLINASNVHPDVALATFTHSVRTRANAIKFAHQSLCNPQILTLSMLSTRGSSKGAQIWWKLWSSSTSIPAQQWQEAAWKDPTMASVAPDTINQKIPQYNLHWWPRFCPWSYLFSMQSLCTQALRMACNWDPTSLRTTATTWLQICFVLEHSKTKIAALSTMTSRGHSLSCHSMEAYVFCPLPPWIKCHPHDTHCWVGQHQHNL